LQLDILETHPGSDGFPVAIVHLRNMTSSPILITYAPNTVTIHCGDFVQHGPGETFGLRHEILDGYSDLDFAPPTSGWSKTSANGQVELMLPSRLPPGNYDLWAGFDPPGEKSWNVQTTHRTFTVP
jgi:hypothetical protein